MDISASRDRHRPNYATSNTTSHPLWFLLKGKKNIKKDDCHNLGTWKSRD